VELVQRELPALSVHVEDSFLLMKHYSVLAVALVFYSTPLL